MVHLVRFGNFPHACHTTKTIHKTRHSMSLATVLTRAHQGIHASLVQVEAHLANGLPAFTIVGLPEAAVKESRDRVRAAIVNAQFEFPAKRITINLAPADLPKMGGLYDLPIAIGILVASGQLHARELEQYELVGELALGGELRSGKGILPIALATKQANRQLIVPQAGVNEAALVSDLNVFGAAHLLDVCAHLSGQQRLPAIDTGLNEEQREQNMQYAEDFAQVQGQERAKRALQIAAAGGHHVLMAGPPGTGKSMLATRFKTILPPMTEAQAIEAAAVQSISNMGFDSNHWMRRITRSPHHSVSSVALVGGGSVPMPGEISLAHHSVLFLDELTEFNRQSLEALREPLETGHVTISRAARQASFPAQFQLIAAMNPCPCGFYGDAQKPCHCTPDQIARYRGKLSGPLLDRIDLHLTVPRIKTEELHTHNRSNSESKTTSSQALRMDVMTAFERQMQRQNKQNAHLNTDEIQQHCALDAAADAILKKAMTQLNLSMRSYHRILKVARSIADLANADTIQVMHLSEALGYRPET